MNIKNKQSRLISIISWSNWEYPTTFYIYILLLKWCVINTLLLNCNGYVVGKMLNDAFKPSLSLFRFTSQARMRYFNFFHSLVISLLAYIYLATHATNSSHHIKFLFASSSTFWWVFIHLVTTIFHTNFEVKLFFYFLMNSDTSIFLAC